MAVIDNNYAQVTLACEQQTLDDGKLQPCSDSNSIGGFEISFEVDEEKTCVWLLDLEGS